MAGPYLIAAVVVSGRFDLAMQGIVPTLMLPPAVMMVFKSTRMVAGGWMIGLFLGALIFLAICGSLLLWGLNWV